MRATCLITFVETTPRGMLVGNAGDTIKIHDEALFERLLAAGKISAADGEEIAGVLITNEPLVGLGEAIQLPNADGSPLMPPVAKAEPKTLKPRAAKVAAPAAPASPVDAPVE